MGDIPPAATTFSRGSRGVVEQLREQARELQRRQEAGEQIYMSAADIQQMFAETDNMEREMEASTDQTGKTNAEIVRRSRPAVTDRSSTGTPEGSSRGRGSPTRRTLPRSGSWTSTVGSSRTRWRTG